MVTSTITEDEIEVYNLLLRTEISKSFGITEFCRIHKVPFSVALRLYSYQLKFRTTYAYEPICPTCHEIKVLPADSKICRDIFHYF
jgi:hypothetical protein